MNQKFFIIAFLNLWFVLVLSNQSIVVAGDSKSTEIVASQPSSIITKEDTKSVDNAITVSKKQTDNIIAHQEGQASEAIATQLGPHRMVVELLSTKVTGQILTVTLRFHIPDAGALKPFGQPINQVNYIEDDTGKQVGVLQNEQGEYLASPKVRVGMERLQLVVGSEPSLAWIKFPVPSPETQTISINIPGVFPFDGVSIKR